MTDTLDPNLRQFGTDRQKEIFDAVELHGGLRSAARSLGCDYKNVHAAVAAIRRKAASQGYSPEHDMTKTVPDGFKAKGVSTYYDSEGKVRGQWVKSTADNDRREELQRAALAALAEELPRLKPVDGPAVGGTKAELCNVLTLTDCHVGMMAWHREGGADWDLKIAESTLVKCFEEMILSAPRAKRCVVNQLGDFLHYDGWAAATPTSGHLLDADGRFPQMVAVAIRTLRRIVDMALQCHDEVTLVIAVGNHDLASAIWLQAMFAALYEKEPRLTVNDSALPYYIEQHGETMLGFHHGHGAKKESLPLLFAAQFPKVWGGTTKRYIHTGHQHHVDEKEYAGATVTQHATLSARDAYAARGGWLSERQATAMTYHSKYGLVARNTVTPEMVSM